MVSLKSYSIIIVPSDHSGTRQYRLSRGMLFVLLALIVLILTTFVVFATTYTSVLTEARRADDLQAENRALRMEIERISELSAELESMASLRAQVVRLLGSEELLRELETQEVPTTTTPDIEAFGVDDDRLRELVAATARQAFLPRGWPADGRVRREFSPVRVDDEPAHPGLAVDPGVDGRIRASGRGRILVSEFEAGRGHVVEIDHGYGYRTRYERLDRVEVLVGQVVERGQSIGILEPTAPSGETATRGSQSLDRALYFVLLIDGAPVDPRAHLDPR